MNNSRITYRKAAKEDEELLLQSRLKVLREVNDLPPDYVFTEELTAKSREYFQSMNQSTVFAFDEKKLVGCATLCYLEMMPTFSHPTGKRAHLMNVYTDQTYRRQGLAFHMISMLIREAGEKGVTEISLDATESGRPLYEKLGFVSSEECMVLTLNG